MDSIVDSVTLKLRLGRVAGLCPVDQADQTGKGIPGRGNQYAKVTLVNKKVRMWMDSKEWE